MSDVRVLEGYEGRIAELLKEASLVGIGYGRDSILREADILAQMMQAQALGRIAGALEDKARREANLLRARGGF